MDHHRTDGADAPGLATPHAAKLNPEKELADDCAVGQVGDQEKQQCHSAEATAARKRLDTVTAELALRGFELRRTVEGSLLVLRFGRARELRDVDAAEAFAINVGARP